MSKEQKDVQPPTLPPASEQSSNHISHVLDFGHGEGGNMQPKVERDQEPAFKKRKLDSQSGISSNNDQFSTGPDLVSIECETSKNLSLECQASKDVDSDSQISMIIEDQNHRPESPVDIEKTMASSHNAQVFEIIDDLGSDREEYYESEDDYDDDDIDALLDECLDKPRNTSASEADVDGDVDTETDPSAPEEKEKVVLIGK
ncbi:uncharacterized protein LOC106170205 [Lingula anatina]|uniref:Uncharacterized protein LOC106170205 n=1 Tax=Lingula anatina TaxID=7574 RepID=A0A1S3J4W9_LINAN|nr:uncharacterized protein LOC106170205 [Lingula anatina]|eukprot:XP_013405430.1 uncharacterized protein LOC106170205 [Lingula anatina]